MTAVRRPSDLIYFLGRCGTGMGHASRVGWRVGIETGRLAVVAIVDDRLVAEDPSARDVFARRIHQSGIGRMNVINRLMPPWFVAVHAGASFASRTHSISDDCMLETIPGVGEGG
jgi:hypothetical protein